MPEILRRASRPLVGRYHEASRIRRPTSPRCLASHLVRPAGGTNREPGLGHRGAADGLIDNKTRPKDIGRVSIGQRLVCRGTLLFTGLPELAPRSFAPPRPRPLMPQPGRVSPFVVHLASALRSPTAHFGRSRGWRHRGRGLPPHRRCCPATGLPLRVFPNRGL